MTLEKMSEKELKEQIVGEAITVTAVMAILCSAIVAVIIYKLFFSNKGKTKIPGGWEFTWEE